MGGRPEGWMAIGVVAMAPAKTETAVGGATGPSAALGWAAAVASALAKAMAGVWAQYQVVTAPALRAAAAAAVMGPRVARGLEVAAALARGMVEVWMAAAVRAAALATATLAPAAVAARDRAATAMAAAAAAALATAAVSKVAEALEVASRVG